METGKAQGTALTSYHLHFVPGLLGREGLTVVLPGTR